MNKNVRNAATTARRMGIETDGKVIDAQHAVMYSRTADENGIQISSGMNIAMNERHTVLSRKRQKEA